MFNRATLVPYLLQILLGMLGAIIVQIILLHSIPKVAIVDITGMVKSFENEVIQQKLTQPELTDKVTRFSQSINSVITDYAKDHRVILVPKEVVISGAEDETDSIKQMIKKRMGA